MNALNYWNMPEQDVHIEKLTLRLPGNNPTEAQRVAEEVTRRLSENLPASVRNSRMDRLNLKVTIPAGTPPESMADFIAESILTQFV